MHPVHFIFERFLKRRTAINSKRVANSRVYRYCMNAAIYGEIDSASIIDQRLHTKGGFEVDTLLTDGSDLNISTNSAGHRRFAVALGLW